MATSDTANVASALTDENRRLGVIGRFELKFLFFFTLALCVVTTVPYVVGRFMFFPGTIFTDVLVHSVDTGNYFAYARQAAAGRWLFFNPMTAEPHHAVFFNLEWLAIGKLSSTMHVPLPTAANIMRLFCLILMCVGVYWLSSFLFRGLFMRRVALVTALAGGGFGWLATVHLFHIPLDSSVFVDLSNGNLFPFMWALKVPHFLASESLVVLALCLFLSAERSRSVLLYIASGLCYMASGCCRPYDMLFLMVATSVFLAWRCIRNRGLLGSSLAIRTIPVLMCMPLLGYYFWIFKIHPIFKWWSLPGNPAPAAWLLALGFGMTFLFLPFSLWRVLEWQLTDPEAFILCCFITATLLTYTHRFFHFSFQFATNIFVPMVMIVLAGLEKSITNCKKTYSWANLGIVALLIVNSLTSLALVGHATLLVTRGDYRVDTQQLEAYSWLNSHSQSDEVTLADFDNSNHIPQYTHNIVFCGYPNAVNFAAKLRSLQKFFDSATSNDFRQKLIEQNRIQFVLLTANEEREIAARGTISSFREVFRNSAFVIFSVRT